MSQEGQVYDLGEVETDTTHTRASRVSPPKIAHRSAGPGAAAPAARTALRSVERIGGFDLPGSLSLFVPGAGQMLRGQTTRGIFFLASIGFLATLGWAVLGTLDRLSGTLGILGYPAAAAAWALGLIYFTAGALYVANVLDAEPEAAGEGSAPHPLLAALASALLPGWGQVLNGDRARAALLLGSLWLVGVAWILVSPPAREVLGSLGLYLPGVLERLTSPAVRWTLPAVVWALAVYDAAATATNRR